VTAALAAADLAALSARVVARCYGHDSVHLASAPTRNAIARLAAALITPARPRCQPPAALAHLRQDQLHIRATVALRSWKNGQIADVFQRHSGSFAGFCCSSRNSGPCRKCGSESHYCRYKAYK